jgi:hypothetical protein
MLKIGINENVYFSGVELNDKKALILQFKQTDGTEKNLIEMLEEDSEASLETGKDIRKFPFNIPNKADLSQQQKFDMVMNDVANTSALFVHLLSPFLTKDEIKLDKFANTGISTKMPMEDFKLKMMSSQVLEKIWMNMANNFIRLSKPLIGRTDMPFRLKLRRQSTDKHYPTLPDRYLDSEPCIELMTIPKEQSKVRFSTYEIKQGLDKDDVLPPSASDSTTEHADMPDNEFNDGMFEPPADTEQL